MSTDDTETLKVVEALLERYDVTAQRHLDVAKALRRTMRIANVSSELDYLAHRMVLEVNAHVWAKSVQDEEVTLTSTLSVQYPATWWQHVKQRFFPAWALRRWPVVLHTSTQTETRRHTFKTVALLPDFDFDPPPGTGEHFVLKSYARIGASRRFPGGGSL